MLKKTLAAAALLAIGTTVASAADVAPRYTKAPVAAAPNWVFGVEGDINALGAKRSVCVIDDACSIGSTDPLFATTKTDYLSTIRARFGYAWDRSLLYVTGGLAIAKVNDSFTDFTTSVSSNAQTRTG